MKYSDLCNFFLKLDFNSCFFYGLYLFFSARAGTELCFLCFFFVPFFLFLLFFSFAFFCFLNLEARTSLLPAPGLYRCGHTSLPGYLSCTRCIPPCHARCARIGLLVCLVTRRTFSCSSGQGPRSWRRGRGRQGEEAAEELGWDE